MQKIFRVKAVRPTLSRIKWFLFNPGGAEERRHIRCQDQRCWWEGRHCPDQDRYAGKQRERCGEMSAWYRTSYSSTETFCVSSCAFSLLFFLLPPKQIQVFIQLFGCFSWVFPKGFHFCSVGSLRQTTLQNNIMSQESGYVQSRSADWGNFLCGLIWVSFLCSGKTFSAWEG